MKKTFILLSVFAATFTSLFGMGYQADVTMTDGSTNTFYGDTHDGRFGDEGCTFGYDRDQIDHIDWSISDYFDND